MINKITLHDTIPIVLIGFKQSKTNFSVPHSTLPVFGLSSHVLTPFGIGPKTWGLTGILGYQYGKISNNWPMC